eukprot:scaffold73610_cov20-Tisochrysis_lutea.AAC.1
MAATTLGERPRPGWRPPMRLQNVCVTSLYQHRERLEAHSNNTLDRRPASHPAAVNAETFGKDFYAPIVDFISAFNTTDHDKMPWIVYDSDSPTHATNCQNFL